MKFLITGYTGFIGGALVKHLLEREHVSVRALVRECPENNISGRLELMQVNDISTESLCGKYFSGVSVVVHCAARAHVMKDNLTDPLIAYKNINTHGTLNLARQAARYGVKRFIFLSSIKVNGDLTLPSCSPFTEIIDGPPDDPYGLSKYEAELGLLDIAKSSEIEVVIIRPPLVYGPYVKGNFATFLDFAKKNYPLPLKSIRNNKRSLIALENLINFLLFCTDYKKTPQAANHIFVISDGEDVSTAELFERITKAYGKKSRLLPFPPTLLRLVAIAFGKQGIADRLLGSLSVDNSKACDLLGWKPVITMDEQLRKIAEADGYID